MGNKVKLDPETTAIFFARPEPVMLQDMVYIAATSDVSEEAIKAAITEAGFTCEKRPDMERSGSHVYKLTGYETATGQISTHPSVIYARAEENFKGDRFSPPGPIKDEAALAETIDKRMRYKSGDLPLPRIGEVELAADRPFRAGFHTAARWVEKQTGAREDDQEVQR